MVTPELHRAFIGFLVSTPAKLVVLNQEDLFLEMNQQNLPGTTDQYPNWKRKMRYSLEDLIRQPEARERPNDTGSGSIGRGGGSGDRDSG